MRTINLRNDTASYLVIEFTHANLCKRAGVCLCDDKTGAPPSLHIAPQCWARDIHEALLANDDLKALIDKRAVLLKHDKTRVKSPAQRPADAVQMQEPKTAKTSGRRAAKPVKE